MSVRNDTSVYFSYNNRDLIISSRLAEDLIIAGVDISFDRFDIHPDDERDEMLLRQVEQSAAAVIVLSAAYIQSSYCLDEFKRLSESNKPLIFVQIEAIADQTIWQGDLAQFTPIDLTAWRDPAVYSAGVDQLFDRIYKEISSATGVYKTEEAIYLLRLIAQVERRLHDTLTSRTAQLNDDGIRVMGHQIRPQTHTIQSWLMRGSYRFPEVTDHAQADDSVYSRYELAVENLYELLQAYPQIGLIGPEDSGKSVVLLYLTLYTAHNRLRYGREHPLPLLLTLADWRAGQTIEAFVKQAWTLDSDVIELAMRGGVQLIIDGLNELDDASSDRKSMIQRWFKLDSAPRKVIVAGRQTDWYQAPVLDLPVVRLDSVPEALAIEIAEQLLPANRQDGFSVQLPALEHIAHNPFVLGALMFLHMTGKLDTLPTTRGQVIAHTVQALWEHANHAYVGRYELEHVTTGLTQLAYQMLIDDAPLFVNHQYALAQVGEDLLVQTAIYLNFLQAHGTRIRFSDDLIWQYFAASGLLSEGVHQRLTYPTFDANGQRQPTRWDDLILLAAEIAERPLLTLQTISQVDPYLAVTAIDNGVKISEMMQQDIIVRLIDANQSEHRHPNATQAALQRMDPKMMTDSLMRLMRADDWALRQAAYDALTDSWNDSGEVAVALYELDRDTPDAVDALMFDDELRSLLDVVKALRHPDQLVRSNAIWTAGQIGDRAAIVGLLEILKHADTPTTAEVLTALGTIGDPSVIPTVMRYAVNASQEIATAAQSALIALNRPYSARLLRIVADDKPVQQNDIIDALADMRDELIPVALLQISRAPRDFRLEAARGVMRSRKETEKVKRLIRTLAQVSSLRERETFSSMVTDVKQSIKLPANASGQGSVEDLEFMKQRITGTNPQSDRKADQQSSAEGTPNAEHALHHTNWVTRYKALRELRDEAPNEVLPILLEAIHDNEPKIRIEAIEQLAINPDPRALNALLLALNDGDIIVIDAAADALRGVGKPAVPGLTEMVRQENVNTRAVAIETLGNIGDPIAVREITPYINDNSRPWLDDKTVGEIALQALINIGTPEARAVINQHWQTTETSDAIIPPGIEGDDFAPVHLETAEFTRPLMESADEDPQSGMFTALYSTDWDTSQQASKALRDTARKYGSNASQAFKEALIKLLEDENWSVRWTAVESLAWSKDATVIPKLSRLIHDENWTVRVAAVRAMTEIGDPSAIPYLMEFSDDQHSSVREAAIEALGIVRSEEALTKLAVTINDPEPLIRLAATMAISAYRDHEAVYGLLMRMVKDSDTHVRWVAVKGLHDLKNMKVVPTFIQLLGDNSRVRWEKLRICDIAADGLRLMRTPEGDTALKQWIIKQRKNKKS